MNRSLWILAICLLTLAPALGQERKPLAPTDKRPAELVLVPAVVTQNGQPMKGLTANDFVLLHNGQPVPVAQFEEINAVPAKMQPLDLSPRTVQNYAPADSHQDVVILLLDYLNTASYSEDFIRRHLSEIVRPFSTTHTPVTLLVLSEDGLIPVHTYAGNADSLLKAVDLWRSKEFAKARKKEKSSIVTPVWASLFAPTEGTYSARALRQFAVRPKRWARDSAGTADVFRERKLLTLRAVEQLAEAFRGIPGRKTLIWLTAEAFRNPSQKDMKLADPMIAKAARVWNSLNDSNADLLYWTIVSPFRIGWINSDMVGERGYRLGGTPNPMMSETQLTYSAHGSALSPIPTSNFFFSTCDEKPAECIQATLADTHYYLLGFHPRGEAQPGWQTVQVQVSVNQPKMMVRARNWFVVGEGVAPSNLNTIEKDVLASASQQDDPVKIALASPLDYTSIPLRLHWSVVSTQDKNTAIELELTSPPGSIALNPEDKSLNVDFLAFVRPEGAAEGQPFPASLASVLDADQQKSFATAGFSFRKQVPLAPGRYEVRVLLRDNVSQKMGTVSTIIDLTAAPPAKPGATQH